MEFVALLLGLTAITLAAALWPLLRGGAAEPDRAGREQAVYRDQLAELERDLARGVLAPSEAEAARLEISRRLLATASVAEPKPRWRPNRALAMVIALLVAADAGWIYLRLGDPGVPDMPFATRPAPPPDGNTAELRAAIAAMREAAARDPGNAARWLVLARAEGGLNDWTAAAGDFRRAVDAAPGSADALVGLGTALTIANADIVTEPARDAFARAVAHDPKNAIARFYLALAAFQAGEKAAAVKDWQALAADLPEGDGVRAEVLARLKAQGVAPPPPAAPPAGAGPDAAAMAGAAQMTAQDRAAFIRTMIARLAERMAQNPGDFDGWMRLARVYRVSGDTAKADAAMAHAAALRPNDPAILLERARALVANMDTKARVPDQAVALFARVEAQEPAQPDALWYLGLAAAQQGRRADARAYWVRLLPLLEPGSGEHKMVAGALAAITGAK